jgi:hypothetical protein
VSPGVVVFCIEGVELHHNALCGAIFLHVETQLAADHVCVTNVPAGSGTAIHTSARDMQYICIGYLINVRALQHA